MTIFRIVTDEASSDDDVDEWKDYIITDLLSTLCINISIILCTINKKGRNMQANTARRAGLQLEPLPLAVRQPLTRHGSNLRRALWSRDAISPTDSKS